MQIERDGSGKVCAVNGVEVGHYVWFRMRGEDYVRPVLHFVEVVAAEGMHVLLNIGDGVVVHPYVASRVEAYYGDVQCW